MEQPTIIKGTYKFYILQFIKFKTQILFWFWFEIIHSLLIIIRWLTCLTIGTRRPDGSYRKDVKVRPGFKPIEIADKYKAPHVSLFTFKYFIREGEKKKSYNNSSNKHRILDKLQLKVKVRVWLHKRFKDR